MIDDACYCPNYTSEADFVNVKVAFVNKPGT